MGSTQKKNNTNGDNDDIILIKKYANRRLYNTATSSYVTLEHLAEMVRKKQDFVVRDAKSGNDITRSVLTQIIVDEESKGSNMLPVSVLRQLIGFYGDNMQFLIPQYLEQAMEQFSNNQDNMRQSLGQSFNPNLSGMFPMAGQMEEMGKKNMALFMNMFSGNLGTKTPSAPPETPKNEPAQSTNNTESTQPNYEDKPERIAKTENQLATLQEQLNQLQNQLKDLDIKKK